MKKAAVGVRVYKSWSFIAKENNNYCTIIWSFMRLLIAPSHYVLSDKFGSEPLWSYSLIKYLSRYFTEIDVITGTVDLKNPLPSNVNIYQVYSSRSANPLIEFIKYALFLPLVTVRSVLLIKKKDYRIIHHMFPLSLYTFNPLVPLVKIIDRKIKIVLGPLQLPQEHTSKQDLSIILTGKSNNTVYLLVATIFFRLAMLIVKPFVFLMYKSATVVVCNSMTSLKHYDTKVAARKLLSIPTGVEIPESVRYSPRNMQRINIICVGQLTERKGQIFLLEAFREIVKTYPQVFLTLIGDGAIRGEYEKYVAENKLTKSVSFLGVLPHDRVLHLYETFDVFCLPSISDPSPTVILEAMSFGLPVIATDVGSIPEMVGDAGIIVKRADAESLKKGLIRLIENPNLRKDMGRKGEKRIKEVYSWLSIAKRWNILYKSL